MMAIAAKKLIIAVQRVQAIDDRLWLITLLAVAVCLRLLVFSGVDTSDSSHYVDLSYKLTQGAFEVDSNVITNRLGIILPTALSFLMFGASEEAAIIFPLVMSLIQILCVWFLGGLLFSKALGWLAAVLLAFLPAHALLSTQVMTDLPAATWITVAILFIVLAGQQAKLSAQVWSGFLAGLSYGLSVATKEVSVVLIPVIVVVILTTVERSRRLRTGLAVTFGFLLVVGLQGLYFYREVGTPVPFLGIMAKLENVSYSWFGQTYAGWELVRRVTVDYWGMLLAPQLYFGYHYWLLVGAIFFLLFSGSSTRTRVVWLVLFWLAVPLLFHEFGTTSISRYRPISLVPRYQGYVFAPLSLLLAWWLYGLASSITGDYRLRRVAIISLTVPAFGLALTPWLNDYAAQMSVLRIRKADFAFGVFAVAALVLCAFASRLENRGRWSGNGFLGDAVAACMIFAMLVPWRYTLDLHTPNASCQRDVAAILGEGPDRAVYGDERTVRVLQLFYEHRYDETFRQYPEESVEPPAYVVIDWNRLNRLRDSYGTPIPDFVQRPPATWVRVLGNGVDVERGCDLYRIDTPLGPSQESVSGA